MNNSTIDLVAIRKITNSIAKHTRPTETSYPFICIHPFLESPFWDTKFFNENKGGQMSLEDIPKEYDLYDEDTYMEWYEEFKERVNKADFNRIYSAIWRDPYKLTFLDLCGEYLDEKTFAETLADAWVTEENPNMDSNVSPKESLKWFKSANKEYLMSKEDLAHYNSLPDELDIYRGVGRNRTTYGLSWTDNPSKAEWFMKRFSFGKTDGIKMLKAHVSKEDVVAYFNTRNEEEILLDVFSVKKKGLIKDVTEEFL